MLSFGGVDRVVGKVTAFARQQLEPTPPIVPLFRASETRLTSGAGLPSSSPHLAYHGATQGTVETADLPSFVALAFLGGVLVAAAS